MFKFYTICSNHKNWHQSVYLALISYVTFCKVVISLISAASRVLKAR